MRCVKGHIFKDVFMFTYAPPCLKGLILLLDESL